MPVIALVGRTVEGDNNELIILREEHHVVVEIADCGFRSKLNGGNIVIVDFVIIGGNHIAAGVKNGFDCVEIFFDLIIAEVIVGEFDGDINVIVGVGVDIVRSFVAVFFGDGFLVELGEIDRNFDSELIVIEAAISRSDFVAFAIFDDERSVIGAGDSDNSDSGNNGNDRKYGDDDGDKFIIFVGRSMR